MKKENEYDRMGMYDDPKGLYEEIKEDHIAIQFNQSKKEDSDPQLHLDGQDESSKPLITKVSHFQTFNLVKEGIGNIVLNKQIIATKTKMLQSIEVFRSYSFPRGISNFT